MQFAFSLRTWRISIRREQKNVKCSKLVGSSGLEPPTSRLSGVRSNHLSYEPMLFLSEVSSLVPSSFSGSGGDERDRTDDPLLAKQVLSQLSYTPVFRVCTSKIKQRCFCPQISLTLDVK